MGTPTWLAAFSIGAPALATGWIVLVDLPRRARRVKALRRRFLQMGRALDLTAVADRTEVRRHLVGRIGDEAVTIHLHVQNSKAATWTVEIDRLPVGADVRGRTRTAEDGIGFGVGRRLGAPAFERRMVLEGNPHAWLGVPASVRRRLCLLARRGVVTIGNRRLSLRLSAEMSPERLQRTVAALSAVRTELHRTPSSRVARLQHNAMQDPVRDLRYLAGTRLLESAPDAPEAAAVAEQWLGSVVDRERATAAAFLGVPTPPAPVAQGGLSLSGDGGGLALAEASGLALVRRQDIAS